MSKHAADLVLTFDTTDSDIAQLLAAIRGSEWVESVEHNERDGCYEIFTRDENYRLTTFTGGVGRIYDDE